ncbi:MAG: tryptophan synthase subunit alpha [Alphaproteobacteria bacterium CG11_big_fil_rev_8_21_14_0_20_44_7]|nr:MAG: tryptophan synthase subunit alpha [Alphaproteobacteria bacterium CG11_big_fil_rev_8_21_14_0_20_44_7]
MSETAHDYSQISAENERINACFSRLKQDKKPALITYIMAGDPDFSISAEIMESLPKAGADIIELGMPFSDPMADGPIIQEAAMRSLDAGATMAKTLEQLYNFRKKNTETPVILMGYYNPILKYGINEFCHDAELAGADGLIIVDLPPEEDNQLYMAAAAKNICMIRLIAPTSDEARLSTILEKASGFVYFISLTGTTGTKAVNPSTVVPYIKKIAKQTKLPIAVGFGVKTPEQAQEIGKFAEAVVVGSSIVDLIGQSANRGNAKDMRHKIVSDIYDFVGLLSAALKRTTKLQ